MPGLNRGSVTMTVTVTMTYQTVRPSRIIVASMVLQNHKNVAGSTESKSMCRTVTMTRAKRHGHGSRSRGIYFSNVFVVVQFF
jgi:hypothetical protein